MHINEADLVIIGAGPAGLAAACQARSHGLSVVLLDEQQSVGGQIYRGVEGVPAGRRSILGEDYANGASLATAFRRSGALHMTGAAVWNVGRDLRVNFLHQGASQVIQARRILLASGAMERPFPIPGWTLPGVMGAGAAQILLKSAGALPGEPVVLAGSGPLLYLLASQYLRASVQIKAVVHTTEPADYWRSAPHLFGAMLGWSDLSKGLGLIATLRRSHIPVYAGASRFSVVGRERAEALCFTHKGDTKRIDASLILLHQGVVPNTQLTWSLRAKHRWSTQQLCWLPETDTYGQIETSGIYVAGDSRGIVGARAAVSQGKLAAINIAAKLGCLDETAHDQNARSVKRELKAQLRIRPFLDALYRPLDSHRIPDSDETIVCRCEDVSAAQIREYVRLGCHGPNQTKAFGRCGMGPCQGRLCGLTVTEIIADARESSPEAVGYYRIRPPIKPVTLGELSA
jgi:NADPH-dependent 2,4-dienoyl-CoA reductase/sulfur reductase-like enzyme